MAKLTTEEFIAKAKAVHGDKYDYSKVEYVDSTTKVCIGCKKHGDFWQKPNIHLQGKGCFKCGREKIATSSRKSLEQFLQDAKRIHGDRYNYSKVELVNYQTKVIIICPVHGEFTQSPTLHLQGSGCPKCGNERESLRMTTEGFIQKAKQIHGDRYDYSKVEYVGNKAKVCIICRDHGEFWQEARMHLSGCGCPICAGRKKMRTYDFIKKARSVHGDRYDYSKAEYKGNTEKVCIICPEHGEFWQQASNHLKGAGCPKCGFITSSSKQRIWTRERCFELAMRYKDLTSFAKECQVAYGKACRNDWIRDYSWLERKSLPSGYWTKELVMEEAHKYSSSGEFKKGSKLAYNAACRNGWIKAFVWFSKPKNAKKWDYDTCLEEAHKYVTRAEFRENAISAYNKARDNGWLEEYTWLAITNPWNYNSCMEEAHKYIYYHDFRSKSHDAFMTARNNGWLKLYTWLIKEPIEPYNKKWNYETCFAEAKKYKTRSEFNKKRSGAYDVARRNGWLVDYIWMPDLTESDAKVDSVYCYVFEDQKAAYVGRTLMYRQHIRDIEHGNYEKDAVYKFAHKHNCDIPQMKIIEENLTIQQGREREDYWRKYYEANGYTMLNRGATGKKSGSIGAIASGKWTFEKAYKIAQAFQTVNEMCEEYEYLYKISKARGWLEKFDWFRGQEIRIEKATKWTEEVCREEALKYASRKEFRRMCEGAYNKAKEMGWLESYDWLAYNKLLKEWDYESCKKEAMKYPNRNEFGKRSHGAYKRSLQEGWLDDFYPNPLRRLLDYETCKRLASQYSTPFELLKADRSLHGTIKKKGWMKDFFPEILK